MFVFRADILVGRLPLLDFLVALRSTLDKWQHNRPTSAYAMTTTTSFLIRS